MKKIKYILVLATLAVCENTFTPALGQTNVVKRTAMKSNDYGITYFLPKTMLVFRAEVSKVNQKAGIYSKYAEKYLGITDVVTEDKTYYTLDNVSVSSKGIPNNDESYLVELKSKTLAPFMYLTEDGLICTINADYALPEAPSTSPASIVKGKNNNVLDKSGIKAESAYTEEYLRAGSVSKMAEVAAKQIYKLRESRMDILTGDVDNAPRDGAAMKIVMEQLDAQEKALVELFSGTTTKERQQAEFELNPQADIEKEVIFRFSKYLGVVEPDDLSGSPVYINMKKMPLPAMPVDPKKDKQEKGIVYNIPGKASVDVYFGKDLLTHEEVLVTQFGSTQVLATSIFEDKKAPVRVYFYPETGAIKQIVQ